MPCSFHPWSPSCRLQQLRHFESNLEIFKLKPSDEAKSFGELVAFISAVAHCYPDSAPNFPAEIQELLSEHSAVLDPHLRMTLCRSLILLRNKVRCMDVPFLHRAVAALEHARAGHAAASVRLCVVV